MSTLTHKEFKPCPICSSKLICNIGPEIVQLQAGLHATVAGARPVVVPPGEAWTSYRWLVQCMNCTTYFNYLVVRNPDGDTVMTEAIAPASAEQAKKSDRKELLEKVRRLSESIQATESAKKAASKDYNEELKGLKEELHDVLDQLKDTPEPKA